MKTALAIVGLVLLVWPVLRFATIEQRAEAAEGIDEMVAVVAGISGGLMLGAAGAVLLGLVCDGGKGFKPLWLVATLAVLGVVWCVSYPGGWLLGAPLVVYSSEKLYRKVRTAKQVSESGIGNSP